MKPKEKRFLMLGVCIALMVAFAAPFVASENPDGLESTSEKFEETEGRDSTNDRSPMSGYTISGLENKSYSGAVSTIIGTITVLIILFSLLYGLNYVRKHNTAGNNEPERNKRTK